MIAIPERRALGAEGSERPKREFSVFQLTKKELELWRSQNVISKPAARTALRRRPYAFTEQGVAMLSSVFRSSRAVKINIAIMYALISNVLLSAYAQRDRGADFFDFVCAQDPEL